MTNTAIIEHRFNADIGSQRVICNIPTMAFD